MMMALLSELAHRHNVDSERRDKKGAALLRRRDESLPSRYFLSTCIGDLDSISRSGEVDLLYQATYPFSAQGSSLIRCRSSMHNFFQCVVFVCTMSAV